MAVYPLFPARLPRGPGFDLMEARSEAFLGVERSRPAVGASIPGEWSTSQLVSPDAATEYEPK